MRIISWNMGCAPPMARYRKSHQDAWAYFLKQLKPDIAFIQEALRSSSPEELYGGKLVWSSDIGSESGTAIWVRDGLDACPVTMKSEGSYLAAVELTFSCTPITIVSVHVGGPNYRKHLKTLAAELEQSLSGKRFIVGGDFNAARLLDHVQGGKWFTRYFEHLESRSFCDCHWRQHGKEVQSFWGHQTKNPYQCDHYFVDAETINEVKDCHIIDNSDVRHLSDHGPIYLDVNEIVR